VAGSGLRNQIGPFVMTMTEALELSVKETTSRALHSFAARFCQALEFCLSHDLR